MMVFREWEKMAKDSTRCPKPTMRGDARNAPNGALAEKPTDAVAN